MMHITSGISRASGLYYRLYNATQEAVAYLAPRKEPLMKPAKATPGLFHAESDEPLTKTELAVRALRSAIRSGQIPQGEQLTVGELAEQLGISPTPVREAVRTLQAEGLITQTPHHTLAVIKLGEKDLHDIYVVRLQLEPMAVRLAVPLMSAADLDLLHRLNETMHATDHEQHSEQRYALNQQWHFALYGFARNRVLQSTIAALWQRFLWRTSWILPDHAGASYTQHSAILAAARAGDAEQTAQLMAEHIIYGQGNALIYLRQMQAPIPATQGELR